MRLPKKVLLVDDDDFSALLAEIVLKKVGLKAELLRARHGREALEIVREACLKNSCPDLVLLDIHMPEMDGFEFLIKLQEHAELNCSTMQVILLSSSPCSLEIGKSCGSPVIGCVEKPLTPDKLSVFL